MADQPQERLGRIRPAGVQAAEFRMILADAGRTSPAPAARAPPAARRPAASPAADAPRPVPRSAAAARGRATARPPRRAASGAARRSPARTARRRTRRPRHRTRGGPRRTRSGSAPTLSSSPPHAACVITSAWLATTSSAVRARRIVCSTKQRRQCGQAAWMHSPRRSARPRMVAAPNSSASQPGRSPPWMSPSSVTSAQRAIRPSGMTEAGASRDMAGPTASSRFSRQR